ncbi:hypothetical protein [Luteimonas arsenica]|nr:hypothetical protein [Luteimonas arsenica]
MAAKTGGTEAKTVSRQRFTTPEQQQKPATHNDIKEDYGHGALRTG